MRKVWTQDQRDLRHLHWLNSRCCCWTLLPLGSIVPAADCCRAASLSYPHGIHCRSAVSFRYLNWIARMTHEKSFSIWMTLTHCHYWFAFVVCGFVANFDSFTLKDFLRAWISTRLQGEFLRDGTEWICRLQRVQLGDVLNQLIMMMYRFRRCCSYSWYWCGMKRRLGFSLASTIEYHFASPVRIWFEDKSCSTWFR